MNNAKLYLYTSSDDDNFSMISDCELTRVGESITIYVDDPSGNMIIGISEGILTLTKTGEQNYTLVLEKGISRPLEVHTQFGIITAELIPLNVLIKDSVNELKVYLKYKIKTGETTIFSNTVKMKCLISEELK